MLQILGSRQNRADRIGRRALLQTGALGLCGLAGLRPSSDAAASPELNMAQGLAFGRARRCLVLYIYGAWSQLDTFDPKPEAPAEIRGEFQAIDSCLSGIQVCEHLPRSAQILDRCTLIRSMSHPWNIHSASYTLTGNPDTERIEGRQRHPDQWPYIGGVVDYLAGRGHFGPTTRGIPTNVMLPWRQSLFARPNQRSGTFGGFLGTDHDPLWTEFRGPAPLGDPFRAITPEGRFTLGAADAASMSLDTLDRRQSLLSQFEQQSESMLRTAAANTYTRQRQRAIDFLTTGTVRDALKLEREPIGLREDYGMTLFGQACTSAGAPGRGHWSRAYCQLFAGAGVPCGQVVGASDAIAGDVTDRPINPKDILCTAYHLLGVDPRQELLASPGRLVPLVAGGDVVRELLSTPQSQRSQ